MKIENKYRLTDKSILWIIFALYIVFNLYLLLVHEMWRDEINVWLMGRDLSVIQLLQELKYQGHPCLWYLLIMPFAKLGLPCQVMGIVSMVCMGAATWLFLFHGPFSILAKFVLVFSPAFTYYYPVIARAYCLVALGIILVALYYKRRYERPVLYGLVLGLLVQAETIAVPVAGFISSIWVMDAAYRDIKGKKLYHCIQTLKGVWIPLVSFILYMATMAKVSDSPVFEIRDLGLYDTIQAMKQMLLHICNRLIGSERIGGLCVLICLFLIAFCWMLMTKNILPWGVFAGTVIFQVMFSVIIYELNIWHFLSLVFVFIWTLWICGKKVWNENKWQKGLYLLTQLFLILFGLQMFFHWSGPVGTNLPNALHGSYSDAKNVARYIKTEISTEELIVEVNVPYTSTVWGYLPEYRAYFAGSGEMVSYADWSEIQSQYKTFSDLQNWVQRKFPEKQSYILIVSPDSYLIDWIENKENVKKELLYQTTTPSERQEDYQLYRIYLK